MHVNSSFEAYKTKKKNDFRFEDNDEFSFSFGPVTTADEAKVIN